MSERGGRERVRDRERDKERERGSEGGREDRRVRELRGTKGVAIFQECQITPSPL